MRIPQLKVHLNLFKVHFATVVTTQFLTNLFSILSLVSKFLYRYSRILSHKEQVLKYDNQRRTRKQELKGGGEKRRKPSPEEELRK